MHGSCSILPQFSWRERVDADGHTYRLSGLPGMPRVFALEHDDNFRTLALLYLLALTASVAGWALTTRLRRAVRRPGLHAYSWYYTLQIIANLVLLTGFFLNRCAFHNLQECDATRDFHTACKISGGGWGTAAKVAVLSAFATGPLTNGVLELGVLHSLRGLRSAAGRRSCSRAQRALHALVWLQLLCLLVATPLLLCIFGVLVTRGADHVMAEIEALQGTPHAGTTDGMALAQVSMAGLGAAHIGTSVCLLVQALRLAYKERAFEARRVAVASALALTSSTLCYMNFLANVINWYVALALDSIVNDGCVLAVLLVSDPERYVATGGAVVSETSKEPEHGPRALEKA